MGIGANLELPLLEELAPGQPWAPGPRGVISEFMSAATPEVAIAAGRRAIQTPLSHTKYDCISASPYKRC